MPVRKSIGAEPRWTAFVAPLLAAVAIAQGPACKAAPPATDQPATVRVDFATTRGPLLQTERFNNVVSPHAYVAQWAGDVKFLNDEGLHGRIYRVWLDDDLYDASKGVCNCDQAADYLSNISELSDAILVNFKASRALKTREAPAQMVPMLETIFGTLKKRFPKIDYLEAFNEADYHYHKTMTPADLYRDYVPFYEAVNEINAKLHPKVPMRVGGPALYEFDVPWLEGFLAAYAADPSPQKRLDFISYHAYGYFAGEPSPRNFRFYKTDPSEVAPLRGRLDAMLKHDGLDANIPTFITEMGVYPGPSFDDLQGHGDALRQAAGMATLSYWFTESPKNVPFNWVVRHPGNWRKDELVTRPEPIDEFTPYGNMLLMMSKMKATRVSAASDRLQHGKGIYVLASKDDSGASVLIWNYQDAGNARYRAEVELSHLPPALRSGPAVERVFRIDAKTSNYYADPKRPDLQQVASRTITLHRGYRERIELGPNDLELILLEGHPRASAGRVE